MRREYALCPYRLDVFRDESGPPGPVGLLIQEFQRQQARVPLVGCDRSIPTPLCRQWLLLSGLGRVDASDRKRFRG